MPKAAVSPASPAQIDLALAALRKITPVESIGDFLASKLEDNGTMTLRFANKLDGYPGWQWNVSLALVPDSEPTVLEAELLADDGALLAPEWVPWSVRLAEFLEAQKQAAEAGLAMEEDVPEGLLELADENLSADEIAEVADDIADDVAEEDEDEDLDLDSDDDDFEDEDDYLSARDNVHSGDIDGVELEEEADDEDEED